MPRYLTASALLCAAALPLAAEEITGTASFRERMAVPPGTVFTAVLSDISRADAPAVELGRAEMADAGNPPYDFRIAYDPAAIDPRRRYAVRAELRHDGQLLFTTDTVHPVLSDGGSETVEIVMVRAGG